MQAEENGYWYANKWLTRDVGAGGAGFGTQWDGMFVHPIRQAVITPHDADRSLAAVRDAICHRYNDDAFDRVIFNSDWQGYNDDFSNHPGWDVLAVAGEYDGLPWHGTVSIGPYSALIFSQ